MTRFRYIYAILIAFAFAHASCSPEKHDFSDEEDGQEQTLDVQATLHVQMTGLAKRPAGSRTSLKPGTNYEDKITSMTFFLLDLDNSGTPDWTNVKIATIYPPVGGEWQNESVITLSIITNAGKKHVYAGANMNAGQIASFRNSRGVYTSPGNTYESVIGDFVNPTRGIVMFGQVVMSVDGADEIEISGTPPIQTKVDLYRVVSKISVCYTPDTNPDYLKIKAGLGGSIKAEDVYFMINTTNKTINFTNPASYSLSEYIEKNENMGILSMYYYKKNPSSALMIYLPGGNAPADPDETQYYPTRAIYLPLDVPAGDNPYRKGIDKYNPAFAVADNPDHYASSLYCLENKVISAGFDCDPTLLPNMRQGLNTRVIVAARYIPGEITHWDELHGGLYSISNATESKMEEITSCMYEGVHDENGLYTFYAVVETPAATPGDLPVYRYYTYAAKKFRESQSEPPKFIPYQKGYGYYGTFISQHDLIDDETVDVLRNNYYALNIQVISPPGAVYPEQLYMLVNSETIDWRIMEGVDVTLE